MCNAIQYMLYYYTILSVSSHSSPILNAACSKLPVYANLLSIFHKLYIYVILNTSLCK